MKGNCTKLSRWNGTATELIKGRLSITEPGRSREVVEKEQVLDCDGGGSSATQEKSPGTSVIGDLQIEVVYNPTLPDDTPDPDIVNDHNHHLFEEDYDNETATWWLIEYPNAAGTGIAVHGFVQDLSSAEVTPNNDVKRTFTIVPTGAADGYQRVNDIANYTIPSTPAGPVNQYSS